MEKEKYFALQPARAGGLLLIETPYYVYKLTHSYDLGMMPGDFYTRMRGNKLAIIEIFDAAEAS